MLIAMGKVKGGLLGFKSGMKIILKTRLETMNVTTWEKRSVYNCPCFETLKKIEIKGTGLIHMAENI